MKENKTFENALVELEKIVKELENGSIPLEDAMNKYTTAMTLVKQCQDKLDEATDKVNKILNENGDLEDFDIEQEG